MNKSVFITINEIYDNSDMVYLYINFKCDKYEYSPYIYKEFLIEEINTFKDNGYEIIMKYKNGENVNIINNNFIIEDNSINTKNFINLNLDEINIQLKRYDDTIKMVYLGFKKEKITDGIKSKSVDIHGGGEGNGRKEHGRCHFTIRDNKNFPCEIYLPGAAEKNMPKTVEKIEYKLESPYGKVDEKFLIKCFNKSENLIKIAKTWNELNKYNNTPNLIKVQWV